MEIVTEPKHTEMFNSNKTTVQKSTIQEFQVDEIEKKNERINSHKIRIIIRCACVAIYVYIYAFDDDHVACVCGGIKVRHDGIYSFSR